MTELPVPPYQTTQFKLACAIGAIAGAIGLAGALAELTGAVAGVRSGETWLQDLIWAASGAAQTISAVLLWKGHGGAFKTFAHASIVLSFLLLTRSMDCMALLNLVPLALFIMAVSSEQSPRPALVRVEPMRRNRPDRY